MGIVYKARQLSLGRIVALKALGDAVRPEEWLRAEWQRLRTEAETVALLQHPHIVQVYDFGGYAGLHYIAMEYVAGVNLHDVTRGRHDRQVGRWMPHINLLYPFRPRAESAAVLAELAAACASVEPFALTLGTLRLFRHGSGRGGTCRRGTTRSGPPTAGRPFSRLPGLQS
jgi:serine/threonine protein kinase